MINENCSPNKMRDDDTAMVTSLSTWHANPYLHTSPRYHHLTLYIVFEISNFEDVSLAIVRCVNRERFVVVPLLRAQSIDR